MQYICENIVKKIQDEKRRRRKKILKDSSISVLCICSSMYDYNDDDHQHKNN